ncbi:MAG TPA: T9SS type A sorting domain-containing protein [Cytophagaceae bacterium]|jgi:hypothetical protein
MKTTFTLVILLVFSFITKITAQPQAVIVTPKVGDKFVGGQEVTFSGSALDSKGNALPASSMVWKIFMNHGTGIAQHWHDGIGYAEGVKNGKFTAPKYSDHVLNEDMYFRIFLIAKDATNRTDTSFVDVFPTTSRVTINTNPAGMTLDVSGYGTLATPLVKNVPVDMGLLVAADPTYDLNGLQYKFSHWSDNSTSREIDFTVPSKDVTLTANYTLLNSSLDANKLSSVKVYPTVVSNIFSIDGMENNSENRIILYDANMKELRRILSSKSTEKVNVQDLPAGIYYLNIQSNNAQIINKIYKN